MATWVRVKKTQRERLRLGKTTISGTATGTLIDLDDPFTLRDFRNSSKRFVVLPQGGSTLQETLNADLAISAYAPATGVLVFTRLALPKGFKATKLTLVPTVSLTAGSSVSNQFVGLYSSDGTTLTRVATTGDLGDGAITAGTAAVYTFTAAYTPTTSADFYTAVLVKLNGSGGTVPTWAGLTLASAATAAQGVARAYTLSGQASLPATQLISGVTAGASLIYAQVA